MIPINSHATVRYLGLKDLDGNCINNAVITVKVLDRATGVQVPGITTLTLTYINESNGNYSGEIPYAETATLETEQELTIEYTIVSNSKQSVEKEDVIAGIPGAKGN